MKHKQTFQRKFAGALLTILGLASCMTTKSHEIDLGDVASGRMGVANVRLGETRGAVIAASILQFGDTPVCDSRKVAIKNSRKAFLHETCEFRVAGITLVDMNVERFVCHFIDDQLLRIDLDLMGDESGMQSLANVLSDTYGTESSDDASASSIRNSGSNTSDDAGSKSGSDLDSDSDTDSDTDSETDNSLVWHQGTDEVRIVVSTTTSTQNSASAEAAHQKIGLSIRLQLLDAKIAQRAESLAAD